MTTAPLLAALALGFEPGPWTATDTAVEAAMAVALAADCLQTEQNFRRGGWDRNPLDSHLRRFRVRPRLYFSGALLLHAGVARVLPQPWRLVFQGATLGVEGHAVWANWQVGLRF